MRAKEFLLEFAVPDDDLKWLADHSTSRLKTAIIKAFKAQHKSEQAHKASQAHKIDIERHEKPPEQRKKKDPRLAKPIDEDYEYNDENFFSRLKQMQTDDRTAFDKVMAKVYSHVISNLTQKIFSEKGLPTEANHHFDNIMIDANGKLEAKLEFLKKLGAQGILNPSTMFSGGLGNFDDILKYDDSVYEDIKFTVMNWTPKIGSNPAGKGEMFVILFTDGAAKAAVGDVKIGDITAEVKSYDARLIGHKGYGSTIGTFKEYLIKLKALVPNTEMPDDPNYYNWNYKGLTELNRIFTQAAQNHKGNQIKPLLDWTLHSLYVDSTPSQRDKVVDVIGTDGSFDVNEFIRQWMLFQFDYYKMLEHFTGILFVNPSTLDYLYISDTDDFDKNYDKFHIKPVFSWKDKQSIVIKISLL